MSTCLKSLTRGEGQAGHGYAKHGWEARQVAARDGPHGSSETESLLASVILSARTRAPAISCTYLAMW